MKDKQDLQRSGDDAEIEREIREGRKFSGREAIARMAGPGAMKGASPVSRQLQAEIAIGSWLGSNAPDVPGALNRVLHRQLKGSEPLLKNVDQPLVVLAEHCKRLLASDERLTEFVRQVDVEWGRSMDERPHFEREGSPAHPDDPYTVESVRRALGVLLEKLLSIPTSVVERVGNGGRTRART